jgi:beta-phosphoglucomutase-like phosphatase (HAD superfamily)
MGIVIPALLFDLDGLKVDSEPHSLHAVRDELTTVIT